MAIYACPGSRPTAELAKESFGLGWLTWAGLPVAVEFDRGSAFAGAFEELCNDLGLAMDDAAPWARGRMGAVERKMRHLEETGTGVFNSGGVRGEGAVAALQGMVNARNQLVTTAGFSPRQLGAEAKHRLPSSPADPDNDQAIASRVAENTSFSNRPRARQFCSDTFFQAANSSARRKTALAWTRPPPRPFQPGDLIMFRR